MFTCVGLPALSAKYHIIHIKAYIIRAGQPELHYRRTGQMVT